MEIRRVTHLNVNADVLQKTANVEVGLLLDGDTMCLARHHLYSVRGLLDYRKEQQLTQLCQSGAVDRRAKVEATQLDEVVLGWDTLILLEGVVQCLCHALEMV